MSERAEAMTRAARRILLARIELAVEAILIPNDAPWSAWEELDRSVWPATMDVLTPAEGELWDGASDWLRIRALQIAAGELRVASERMQAQAGQFGLETSRVGQIVAAISGRAERSPSAPADDAGAMGDVPRGGAAAPGGGNGMGGSGDPPLHGTTADGRSGGRGK